MNRFAGMAPLGGVKRNGLAEFADELASIAQC